MIIYIDKYLEERFPILESYETLCSNIILYGSPVSNICERRTSLLDVGWIEFQFHLLRTLPSNRLSLQGPPPNPWYSTKHNLNNDKLFSIAFKVTVEPVIPFLQANGIIPSSTCESSFVKVFLVSSILWNDVLNFFSVSLFSFPKFRNHCHKRLQ